MLSNELTKAHETAFVYDALKGLSNTPEFDPDYLALLKKHNGGYFFKGALHLFGTVPQLHYCDIGWINKTFLEAYDGVLEDTCFAFGEDLFGNFFVFTGDGVALFFIESGETTFVAPNFASAVEKICEEADYYTGFELIETAIVEALCSGYRLCPKLPFILGGDYLPENLVLKPALENIAFSADIARQIKGIGDGERFTLVFV